MSFALSSLMSVFRIKLVRYLNLFLVWSITCQPLGEIPSITAVLTKTNRSSAPFSFPRLSLALWPLAEHFLSRGLCSHNGVLLIGLGTTECTPRGVVLFSHHSCRQGNWGTELSSSPAVYTAHGGAESKTPSVIRPACPALSLPHFTRNLACLETPWNSRRYT